MTSANPRPRLHHVVWCVRRESLPELVDYWTDALGVPLTAFDIEELGVTVRMSWDAGVEIVAPAAAAGTLTPAIDAFLAARGEGVFSAVYEVEDLDVAVTRAVEAGATVTFEERIEPELMAERFGWSAEHGSLAVRQTGLMERIGTAIVLQESRPA